MRRFPSLHTLVSNERVEFPDGVTVYNFTVEGNHNYLVIAETDEFGQTCVLVHNAGYMSGILNALNKRLPSWLQFFSPTTAPEDKVREKVDEFKNLYQDAQRQVNAFLEEEQRRRQPGPVSPVPEPPRLWDPMRDPWPPPQPSP